MNVIKNILVWALTLESRLIVARHKPYIIAVTGSVGKTSTKDAIYSVLSGPHVCDDQHICYVRRSEKSMNSELGLPLTVIGAPNAWHSASGWFRCLNNPCVRPVETPCRKHGKSVDAVAVSTEGSQAVPSRKRISE